jgi:DNA-binding CsgD family transcriptional regulator
MRVTIFAIFLLLASSLHAQNIDVSEKYSFDFSDTSFVRFLTDSEGLGRDEVVRASFIPLEDRGSNGQGTYWYRISVENNCDFVRNSVINLNISALHTTMDVFATINQSVAELDVFLQKYDESYYLQIPPRSSVNIYFKIDHRTTSYFSYNFRTIDNFGDAMFLDYFNVGLFYGFAFMAIIFVFLFYVALREELFLRLIYFYGFLIFMHLSHDGFINSWIGNDELAIVLDSFMDWGLAIAVIVFSRIYLRSKEHFSYDKWLLNIMGVVVSLFFILFLSTRDFIYFSIGDIIMMLIITNYIIQSIILSRKYFSARIFLVGMSVVFFSGWLSLIPYNFGYPDFFFPYFVVKFTLLFAGIVILFGLAFYSRARRSTNVSYESRLETFASSVSSLKSELAIKSGKFSLDINNLEAFRNKFGLSKRESEVILEVVNGLTNVQVSEKLFVSVNTVKFHLKNIFVKLEVSNRKNLSELVMLEISQLPYKGSAKGSRA